MTHSELVKISCKIAKTLGYPLAISELRTWNHSGEIPDVLAFRGGGYTLLIECKVSRADFLADKEKHFRQEPTQGMGRVRCYIMTEGCIRQDEVGTLLPKGWHCIVVDDKGKYKWGTCNLSNNSIHYGVREKDGTLTPPFEQRDIQAELAVLYSYVRRHIR